MTFKKRSFFKGALLAVVFFLIISQLNVFPVYADQVWQFNATGNTQTFTVPADGWYKIEVWGAQGGHSIGTEYYDTYLGTTKTVPGGKGGKVTAKYMLNAGDTITLYVGKRGKDYSNGAIQLVGSDPWDQYSSIDEVPLSVIMEDVVPSYGYGQGGRGGKADTYAYANTTVANGASGGGGSAVKVNGVVKLVAGGGGGAGGFYKWWSPYGGYTGGTDGTPGGHGGASDAGGNGSINGAAGGDSSRAPRFYGSGQAGGGGGGGGYEGGTAGACLGDSGDGGKGGTNYVSGGTNVENIAGARQGDGFIKITQLNTPPSISLSTPNNGVTLGGSAGLNISGTVSDPDVGNTIKVFAKIDSNGAFQIGSNITANGSNQSFNDSISLNTISNGNHTLQVWAEDDVGTKSSTITRTFNVDKYGPTGNISGNPASWQRENAVLVINASDPSGVKRIKKPNGFWVSGSTTSYTVSINGEYTFTMEDNLGNTSSKKVNVTKIDKTRPTSPTLSMNTSWSNGNVSFSISGSNDSGSGIAKYQYKIGNGSWTNGNNGSVSIEGQTTVYARAIDNAGNISTNTSKIAKVDKTKPSTPTLTMDTSWNKGNVSFSISGSNDNGSGIAKYQYKIGNNSWTDGSSGSVTIEGQTTVYARAIDNAGNISTNTSKTARVDKTGPTTPTLSMNTSWSNENVSFSISGSNDSDSGIAKYQYKIGNSSWTDGSSGNVTIEGQTTVYARAIDNVGNISTVTSKTAKIDKSVPIINVSPTSKGWTTETIIINGTVTDGVSGVQSKDYVLTRNTAMTPTSGWETFDGVVKIKLSGGWYLHIKAIDRAGNSVTETFGPYQFEMDNTGPTGNIILSDGKKSTPSLDVSVMVKAFDDISLPEEMAVQLSTDGNNWTSPEKLNSKGEFYTNITFPEDTPLNTYLTVYAKITDSYSNTTYLQETILYSIEDVEADLDDLTTKIQETINQTKDNDKTAAELADKVLDKAKEDNEAPTIELKTVSGARSTSDNSIEVIVDVTDNSPGPYEYWVNDTFKGNLPNDGIIDLQLDETGEIKQNYNIKVSDPAGNATNDTITIIKIPL